MGIFYHTEFFSFDTLNNSARLYASYPASFSSPLGHAEGSFREPSHALPRLLLATWRQSRGRPKDESWAWMQKELPMARS